MGKEIQDEFVAQADTVSRILDVPTPLLTMLLASPLLRINVSYDQNSAEDRTPKGIREPGNEPRS